MQIWPELVKIAMAAPGIAAGSSASFRIITGDLPPNSSETRLRLPRAPSTIFLPVATEPVNAILSTKGWRASASPAVDPSPVTMLITPSGIPASSISSPSRSAVKGVSSAGFSTTVQPDASAGASFMACMTKGAFHGVIAPTTPTGSFRVYACTLFPGGW